MNTNKNTVQYKQPKFFSNIKRYFVAGLIVILPIWITLAIIIVIFKWISGFTKPALEPILGLFFEKEPMAFILSLLSFLLTLLTIYIVGILASNIVSRRILLLIENLLLRIPLLREVYLAARQLVQFIFRKQPKYRQAVLIEFPRKGIYSIGFITSEIQKIDEETEKSSITVFVPTTPNPTTGFLLILPKEDVTLLDISVDEALKMILSGGILSPEKIKFMSKEKQL